MVDAASSASDAVVRGNFVVAKKALDVTREQGDAAVELIRAAADVGNPSNGSVSPAASVAPGGLDINA